MIRNLRIKVVLNKGRIGMPMQKLANITEENHKFLKMLCEDLGIDMTQGQWIALNFKNSSVIYDAELRCETSEIQRKDFVYYYDQIIAHPKQAINGRIHHKTILQYANIAHPLDADELIELGVYKRTNKKPSMRSLTRDIASEVTGAIEESVEYYGAIRGVIDNLYQLSGDKPYLKIRDNLTGKLIDCHFSPNLYERIIQLLEKRKGLITISGIIRANRLERRIESIVVGRDDRMELAEEYRPGDLDEIFGCAPDIMQDMSMNDYMDKVRGRGE